MTKNPSRNFQFGLVFLIALNLLPHMDLYFLPVLVMGGACITWRLLYEFQKVRLPHYILKLVLVAGCTYWVYMSYGRLLGLEPGSALLIMAISLKLVDRADYHDAMVLLLLVFILLLVRVLESQTLWMTLFGAFDLIVVTTLLVQLHSHRDLNFNLATLLKTGGKLVLQVSPFMFALFFVFLRLSSSFSLINSGVQVGTGFSSTVKPGAISKVAKSNTVAFRVRPNGTPLPSMNRYWRGAILPVNNGMTWIVGKKGKKKKKISRPIDYLESPIRQVVILEPRYNEWLFVQDTPHWVEFTERPLTRKVRYSLGDIFSLSSATDKTILYKSFSLNQNQDYLDEGELAFYTKTPPEEDQRVLDLVKELKLGDPSDEAMARKLLEFYGENFRYTLEPGAMKTNNVGEFLFDKKIGFCEHFAVTFAHIMRLSGVPARVVVGFQGGQLNDLGDYIIVKDSDAHAWTEIWSSSKNQWLRYDPTQVVAPLRLELGGEVFYGLSQDQLLARRSSKEYLDLYRDSWGYQIFGRSSLALDALATRWNYFLLTYNQQGQQQFLERLGLGRLNGRLLFFISLIIFATFFFWSRWKNSSQRKLLPSEKMYLRLCNTLSTKGLERRSHEGPQDFLTRSQKGWPEQSQNLQEFQEIYIPWRYSLYNPSKQEIEKLNGALKELRRAKGV